MGLLYQDMKKYNEAELIYNDARNNLEKKVGKHHPDYAHLLNNLAIRTKTEDSKSYASLLYELAQDK